MSKLYRHLVLFLFLACLFACVPQKKIIYLQKTAETFSDTLFRADYDYTIQPKDRLYMKITSFNKDVTEFFNIMRSSGGGGMSGGGMMGGGGRMLLYTYYVGESGYMQMPMLDSIEVAGLTVPQAQQHIQEAIREQVSDAFVTVVLANFQVTVLGEVGGEGIVSNMQNRLTIFGALAKAGDAQDYADRRHVQVIRKTGQDVTIGTIDITKRDIISSEYYYLHPNDIVYVPRLRGKTFLNNLGVVARVVGIVVGFVLLDRLIPKK